MAPKLVVSLLVLSLSSSSTATLVRRFFYEGLQNVYPVSTESHEVGKGGNPPGPFSTPDECQWGAVDREVEIMCREGSATSPISNTQLCPTILEIVAALGKCGERGEERAFVCVAIIKIVGLLCGIVHTYVVQWILNLLSLGSIFVVK